MIKKVWAMYFSGTGTTEKVVKTLADSISKELGCESDIFNFTFPIITSASAKSKTMIPIFCYSLIFMHFPITSPVRRYSYVGISKRTGFRML